MIRGLNLSRGSNSLNSALAIIFLWKKGGILLFLILQVVSTTGEETHSSMDKKCERKYGLGKAGSVLGKAGSVYGISGGNGFTEVKCYSFAETSKKLQKVKKTYFFWFEKSFRNTKFYENIYPPKNRLLRFHNLKSNFKK